MDKVFQKTIGDTVCRVHKTADFTMLSNGFIGSTNISCQAILLLAQAMSLPRNWNFTIKGLEKICAVGETAVRNMLKELETWGYLVRTKLMPSKETHGRIKYIYDGRLVVFKIYGDHNVIHFMYLVSICTWQMSICNDSLSGAVSEPKSGYCLY